MRLDRIRAQIIWPKATEGKKRPLPIATANEFKVQSSAPVLGLCRKLVLAGVDPGTPLEAYNGDMLSLRVRSIGEGARLRVTTSPTGRPVFHTQETIAGASPVEFGDKSDHQPREAAE